MKITHKIDDFLIQLFPQYKKSDNDLEVLKAELANYYSIGPYKPTVSVIDDVIDNRFTVLLFQMKI